MIPTRQLVLALALSAAAASAASGQLLTEQFIPVGESPGVSGVSAVIGTVAVVDAERGFVVVDVDGRPIGYVMPAATHVWLDRSDERLATLEVGVGELGVGDRVEIKGVEPEVALASASAAPAPLIADWIKIDATARD